MSLININKINVLVQFVSRIAEIECSVNKHSKLATTQLILGRTLRYCQYMYMYNVCGNSNNKYPNKKTNTF